MGLPFFDFEHLGVSAANQIHTRFADGLVGRPRVVVRHWKFAETSPLSFWTLPYPQVLSAEADALASAVDGLPWLQQFVAFVFIEGKQTADPQWVAVEPLIFLLRGGSFIIAVCLAWVAAALPP